MSTVFEKDECLAKVREDEPIFILRGQDLSSSLVIIDWIRANFLYTPEDKLRGAFDRALEMKNYHGLKKFPD